MKLSPIQPKHVGYAWRPDARLQPRILSVMQSVCEAGALQKCDSSEWTLDYSFTPFGCCKAGSPSAVWRKRPAFEGHLYPPRTPYWENTRSAGVAQTRGIFISFSGGETALHPSLNRSKATRFHDPSQRLGFLLERMLELGLDLGANGFAKAQAALWEIIALLNAAARNGEPHLIPAQDAAPPITDFLHDVRTYLHERLSERITRANVARHFNLSVSALSHRYRAEAGEGLMATLARMRIHVAKSLLLKGYPLKVIFPQTGFCDEYHLSRAFKRCEGVSPREFRRQTRHDRRLILRESESPAPSI